MSCGCTPSDLNLSTHHKFKNYNGVLRKNMRKAIKHKLYHSKKKEIKKIYVCIYI